jgi:hypothetical protein
MEERKAAHAEDCSCAGHACCGKNDSMEHGMLPISLQQEGLNAIVVACHPSRGPGKQVYEASSFSAADEEAPLHSLKGGASSKMHDDTGATTIVEGLGAIVQGSGVKHWSSFAYPGHHSGTWSCNAWRTSLIGTGNGILGEHPNNSNYFETHDIVSGFKFDKKLIGAGFQAVMINQGWQGQSKGTLMDRCGYFHICFLRVCIRRDIFVWLSSM